MPKTILVINPNSTEAVTLGIPVVEPTQAAVTMAIGRVRLDWESAFSSRVEPG